MATQWITRTRFRLAALLVALALATAVVVVAVQARSIWSAGSHGQPVPAHVVRLPVTGNGPCGHTSSQVVHRSCLRAIRARKGA